MPKKNRRLLRGFGSVVLAAAALWTVSVAGTARSVRDAAERLRAETEFPLFLLRLERGELLPDGLSAPTALALYATPILYAERAAAAEPRPDGPSPPDGAHGGEDGAPEPAGPPEHGAVVAELPPIVVADNGVPARTLRPTDPSGYLIYENVWIGNASAAPLTLSELGFDFPETLSDDAPQVLIVHTHGSEAYTMPAGEEYEPSDDHRTVDRDCSVVRVGDEIARVLEAAGLGVVHDRELYDYPNYSGAYNRSLAAIERCREQYPSIRYVLDVHRDAVTDAAGNHYKLVCAEEPNAAQLEFVVGSDGGGAQHDGWRDNLKLACAVQSTVLEDYPTLMRPITVRNSRYNQHVTAGSLLLEVGTAGNSLEEALVAARLFAEGFAKTLQGA